MKTSQTEKKAKDLFMLTGESAYFYNEDVRDSVAGEGGEPRIFNGTEFPQKHFPMLNQPLREEMKKLKLVNGFRIFIETKEEDFEVCEPDRNFVMVDLFRVWWIWHQFDGWGYKQQFKTYAQFQDHYWDRFFKMTKKYPDRIWGVPIAETDTNCCWPKDHFKNRKEAYQFWKERFFTANYNEANNCFGDFMTYLKKRGIDHRKANLLIHGATLFSIHYYYDWGFRGAWMESTTSPAVTKQVMIAFLRGAARQYHGLWGIDAAPHHAHHTPRDPGSLNWYDAQGRRRHGFSESLFLRQWLVTFLSGANILHEQASEHTHWIFDQDLKFRLSPLGECAKQLAEFTLREHPDRGTTYAPLALMLNFHHGYEGRWGILNMTHPCVWAGKLPFTAEDANITHCLNLFSRHEEGMGAYDGALNPAVPWKTQLEYNQMVKSGVDMRPYEKDAQVESPYGDSVDVILDNAPKEALKQYRIVMLAGAQELDAKQSKRLLDFVDDGGVLIASFQQLSKEMRRKLAVKSLGGDWDYDINTCLSDGTEFSGRRYVYDKLEIPKAKALAKNERDHVLVWEITHGQGQVVLSAVPYSQDSPDTSLLPVCKHVYGTYLDEALIAKAEPATLELITNVGDGFVLVAAFNHGKEPWQGELRIKKGLLTGKIAKAEEIWHRHPVRLEEGKKEYVIHNPLPPFEWEIYKLHV